MTIDDITWDFKKKRSIMFPSVIDMADKLYLYYAGGREHGIGLAISA